MNLGEVKKKNSLENQGPAQEWQHYSKLISEKRLSLCIESS